MRKLAIGRLIGVALALLSILCAIFFYSSANYMFGEFQKWTTARPMKTKIDLSQTGSITVPFHQTFSRSHNGGVFLVCDFNDKSSNVPAGLLAGLSASIVITDEEGKEVVSQELADIGLSRIEGEIKIVVMPTFQIGNYTATITNNKGLPTLDGVPQTIYARYQLCGCQMLPVAVFRFFSYCAGFIGILFALFAAPGLWRSGIWRDVKTEVEPEVKAESDN